MIDAGSRDECPRNKIGTKMCVIVFPSWHIEIASMVFIFRERLVCSIKYEVCCVAFFVKYFNRKLSFGKKRLLWFNDL